MPRKPNYKFERHERDRAKAIKKALRLEAKKEKAEKRNPEEGGADGPDASSDEDMARPRKIDGSRGTG